MAWLSTVRTPPSAAPSRPSTAPSAVAPAVALLSTAPTSAFAPVSTTMRRTSRATRRPRNSLPPHDVRREPGGNFARWGRVDERGNNRGVTWASRNNPRNADQRVQSRGALQLAGRPRRGSWQRRELQRSIVKDINVRGHVVVHDGSNLSRAYVRARGKGARVAVSE